MNYSPQQCQKKQILTNESGMALLITIMILSLLVVVTVQFHKSTWHRLQVSNNFKIQSQLKTVTESGVNIGSAVVAEDAEVNQFDSLLDSWSLLKDEVFRNLFPTGVLTISITDLSGHLQINQIIPASGGSQSGENNVYLELRKVLKNLLMSGNFAIEDEEEIDALLDSIIDWLDPDDQESLHGAESGYYQSLAQSYGCRNGPVQYIEELLLIKGMTPALLFGTAATSGLADFITVFGDGGTININTAPPEIIVAFNDQLSEEMLEDFKLYREDEDNQDSLANTGWYKQISGWPADVILNEAILTSKSSFFEISSTATFNDHNRNLRATIERDSDNKVKLLRKQVE